MSAADVFLEAVGQFWHLSQVVFKLLTPMKSFVVNLMKMKVLPAALILRVVFIVFQDMTGPRLKRITMFSAILTPASLTVKTRTSRMRRMRRRTRKLRTRGIMKIMRRTKRKIRRRRMIRALLTLDSPSNPRIFIAQDRN
jgi:hypothetical protein